MGMEGVSKGERSAICIQAEFFRVSHVKRLLRSARRRQTLGRMGREEAMPKTPTQDRETAAIAALYGHLVRRKAEGKTAVRDLGPEARREYMRRAKRESRRHQREASAEGRADLSPAGIREALADAVIAMIAAGDLAGEKVLLLAAAVSWPTAPGAAMTVRGRVASGRLLPRGPRAGGAR
jgi:hypothetical protein